MGEAQKKRLSRLSTFKYRLSRKATGAEIRFKEILDRYGIVYVFQKGVFTKDPITLKRRFRILDFYIRRCRIGIEIDGGYHFSEYGKRRDAYRDMELSRSRKTLIMWRFTNEEVFSESKEMIEMIEALKEGQSKRLKNHKEKLSSIDLVGKRVRAIDQEVIDAFKNKWQ